MAVLGAAAGFLLLLVGIWWLYKLVRKRKNIELKKNCFKRNGGLLLQQQLSSSDGSIQKTKIFTSKELEKATDGFNDNRILGQGGQGTKEEFEFSWEMRLRIATEVAGALSYLHSAASIPIYHRDIKSTNILLDEKFKAKVSDFGTSRSIAIDQTHLTTPVQELLSGQKPISYEMSEERRSLAIHFILLMEENRILDILDERLVEQDREEQVIAVANLARKCLNLNGRNRPTMREVAIELEQIRLSKGALHAQQSSKELENIRDEAPNLWEIYR
ncbi:hypothetical protein OIU77_022463 [Salix suchowensis]|uniref:Protein kinase domain-containing protein n=1 Tax=Salix suchowensis TaxID=1278906 RepID=A0ABQ9C0E9_9ROSI|nr:hypothetical protein OIU77_022463 [Salix suchowensis]